MRPLNNQFDDTLCVNDQDEEGILTRNDSIKPLLLVAELNLKVFGADCHTRKSLQQDMMPVLSWVLGVLHSLLIRCDPTEIIQYVYNAPVNDFDFMQCNP
jgi:hypothetical protein